jgi:hypothetical protein
MADYSILSPRVVPTKTPKQRTQRKYLDEAIHNSAAATASAAAAAAASVRTPDPESTPTSETEESTPDIDAELELDTPSANSSADPNDFGNDTMSSSSSSSLSSSASTTSSRPSLPRITISNLSMSSPSAANEECLEGSSEECSESTAADIDVDIEDELEPAIVLTDENKDKLRTKRTNIVKEILSTELTYVTNLELIIEVSYRYAVLCL